jgi:hypothetical protein
VFESISANREWTNQASSPPPGLREKVRIKKEIEIGIPSNHQSHVISSVFLYGD